MKFSDGVALVVVSLMCAKEIVMVSGMDQRGLPIKNLLEEAILIADRLHLHGLD